MLFPSNPGVRKQCAIEFPAQMLSNAEVRSIKADLIMLMHKGILQVPASSGLDEHSSKHCSTREACARTWLSLAAVQPEHAHESTGAQPSLCGRTHHSMQQHVYDPTQDDTHPTDRD